MEKCMKKNNVTQLHSDFKFKLDPTLGFGCGGEGELVTRALSQLVNIRGLEDISNLVETVHIHQDLPELGRRWVVGTIVDDKDSPLVTVWKTLNVIGGVTLRFIISLQYTVGEVEIVYHFKGILRRDKCITLTELLHVRTEMIGGLPETTIFYNGKGQSTTYVSIPNVQHGTLDDKVSDSLLEFFMSDI